MQKFKRYLGTLFLCFFFILFTPHNGYDRDYYSTNPTPLTFLDHTTLTAMVMGNYGPRKLWQHSTSHENTCQDKIKNQNSYDTISCENFGVAILSRLITPDANHGVADELSQIDPTIFSKLTDAIKNTPSFTNGKSEITKESKNLNIATKSAVDTYFHKEKSRIITKIYLLNLTALFFLLLSFRFRQNVGAFLCSPFYFAGILLRWIHRKI